MGFLSPYLLAGFAALAVPLWLHLRRKRRQTPVEFPSLRYLRMAAARMKRQAKVEDLGLLVARLLLLALLVAAFARPVVRSRGAWLGAARAVESVVVIDATASMGWHGEGGSRFDAAKRLAREWVAGLDRKDAVALWVLTDRLERPVSLPIADRGQWFKELDALVLSEGSSSLAPVFHAAHEWAGTRGAGRKELVVITDNQNAAWDWPADSFFRRVWRRGETGLVVLAPDTARAPNISVETVRWDGRAVREGSLLTGVARLANCGDAAVTDLLECRAGGHVLLRKPVEIPAAGSLEVPLSLPVPALDGPVLAGELALAGDALGCDDHWYFALPARRAYQVLVVNRGGGMGGTMSPSYFLTRALAAGGAGKAVAIEADAWKQQSTEGIDAVWFTGGAAGDAGAWSKALDYAAAGGTVVVGGDSQADPPHTDWPVTAGEEISLPAGRMATRLLDPEHALFNGVWSEQTVFPPLPQRTVRKCVAAPGAKVLATVAGEYPLLVERPQGKGRVLWLNASADRSWGDLPLSPAFVPLVQQLARARELAMQCATECRVGEAWPDLSKFAGSPAWPAGDDGQAAGRIRHSGLFDALAADGRTRWSCAVNVRREESDLRSPDPAKLQAMLPGRVAAGSTGIHEWREEIRREVPLWPWLLGASALAFLLEGWLSARTAQRRIAAAEGGALSPEKPRFRARMMGWRAGT